MEGSQDDEGREGKEGSLPCALAQENKKKGGFGFTICWYTYKSSFFYKIGF
jgi:hypothetical protein